MFRVGGGEWAVDPATLSPPELLALARDFGPLTEEFPALMGSRTVDYYMLPKAD